MGNPYQKEEVSMKSLLYLWKETYADACVWCRTGATYQWQSNLAKNILRDYETVDSRLKDEGVSFLTITLPAFGKAFERCLEEKQVSRYDFLGFTTRKSGAPAFLQVFLDLVFDRSSGVLLENPSIYAIQAIRQLTLMFSKINMPCSPERNKAALEKYLECEREVKENDKVAFPLDEEVKRLFSLLFAPILSDLDREIWNYELLPHHGPGATADKLTGNSKWAQREWPERLEDIFPFGEYVLPSWRHSHVYQDVNFLEPGKERPVKVVLVPKTLKTPRVIAVEPTCMQYMQQAVAASLVQKLETSGFRMVGFVNQDISRGMARQGSLTRSLATIDLSEASDRVSNQLVRELFARWPHVSAALDATRSRSAVLPDGKVIRLAKFASMGSALCFPVEAMVFTTLALLGIQRSLNTRLTRKSLKKLSSKVRVFGDDIIVPSDHVQCVVQSLEQYGLKVNWSKTFWKGNFRESCGGEYYFGDDVGYVKLRELLPPNRTDAKGVLSLIAFRNLMYDRGYWRAARFCDNWLESLRLPMPIVADESPISGRKSCLPYQATRIHPTLQKPLVKGIVGSTRIPANQLDDWPALTKCFVLPFQEDYRHLERSGRPDTVGIKIRWETPY